MRLICHVYSSERLAYFLKYSFCVGIRLRHEAAAMNLSLLLLQPIPVLYRLALSPSVQNDTKKGGREKPYEKEVII